MALMKYVNRVKALIFSGPSDSSSRSNVGGDAAGPGHPNGGESTAHLKERASGLADKARSEATHLADQAKHAASDLQHRAEGLKDRGQGKNASATSATSGDGEMRDKMDGMAGSAQSNASGATGNLTDRVEELRTSAEAEVENPSTEFEERRS